MMEVRLIIMALICLFIAQIAFAAEDNYPFDVADKQQRFVNLSKEIRCATCQNQSLADSSAPIALDMRAQIHAMLNNGETDASIRTYLSDRYGDSILFNPPLRAQTLALWLGPLLMLTFAGVLFFRNFGLNGTAR